MPLTPRERKAALVLKGVTYAAIARELEITGTQVGSVVAGIRRSSRVEQAVADAIGKPVRAVFPPIEVRQSA